MRLHGKLRSVHFLRGVMSRASMCLTAFYYFLGAAHAREHQTTPADYPFRVAQSFLEFSNLNTLSLGCRKVFDHAAKPDLTGGNFARLSDSVLDEHARYWAARKGNALEDCQAALIFLRLFFREYARTDSDLLKASGVLHKRVGLLKQHADRAAAHLSLQEYELDILDIIHVVAALVIVGEVIRSFDDPVLSETYFNEIDAAAHEAARRTFADLPDFRLFRMMPVQQQARAYWRTYRLESIEARFDQLVHALG